MSKLPAAGTGRLRVGTCAWTDHKPFYPRGLAPDRRLAYYARFFSIVEVDSTYYALPSGRNFSLWADRTPADFIFDVKAYGAMTRHHRQPRPGEEDIGSVFRRFSAAIEPLRTAQKLGAVLFQFPPWFRMSADSTAWLHYCRDFFPADRLAVEFRHRSWFSDPDTTKNTLALLRQLDLAHVIADAPQVGFGSIPWVVACTTPRLALFRFHGRNADTWYIRGESSADRFDYLYTRDELIAMVPAISEMAVAAGEVHLMLNNNRANYAIQNARDLIDILGVEAPTGGPEARAEQLRLF